MQGKCIGDINASYLSADLWEQCTSLPSSNIPCNGAPVSHGREGTEGRVTQRGQAFHVTWGECNTFRRTQLFTKIQHMILMISLLIAEGLKLLSLFFIKAGEYNTL